MSTCLKILAGSAVVLLVGCGAEEQAENIVVQPGSIAVADTQTLTQPELGSFGIDLSNQDAGTRPGDNFFRYTSGGWLDTFEIPASRSTYGAFTVLRDRSDDRVRTIVDDLAAIEPAQGSMEQKISDYYLSYMDTARINSTGISPLRPGLARLADINSIAELTAAFGRSRIETTASPFRFGIGADRVDPDSHQLSLSVGGIGLPDRDYYLLDTDRFVAIREAYVAHIERMLDFANIEDSATRAEAILALETSIAEHLWPRSQRRNRDLTYNPMSYVEFTSAYPGFDWDAYFSAAGIEQLDDLNVSFPSAMSPIIQLVTDIPLQDWKSYMTYRLISSNASVLPEEIDNENFDFYSTVVNGVPQQRERWERGVGRVGSLNSLGEAVGQVYVDRHFPESAKRQMEDLVENLRAALAESIAGLEWMGAETKLEANLKLNSFRPKIAYPDEWTDLSAIEINEDDLFANAQSVREFNYLDSLSRLSKPTNREEWGMTPQTVNAYYNSSFNEIVFPAAILQPPFFDPAADLAVNYGGIGAVIGHEMGHGFDDQGSKVDSRGVQRNWWTDEDRANFDELTTALAAQYDQFEPVAGQFVDGNFTLGENIGDVGGLSLAYRAYKMALNGEEAAVIDGLTGDQRFFLSWAQVWQAKIREDALVSRLKSDPHSPAEFRVNGVVRNFDEWYEAFGVQPDDEMYLPPAERIRIW
ncbi:MAG: M13 family metallopeptidase [Gammaproteobacteria bacterium]|nr:peptidase M13 [Gammaproteobacteria bacterium]MDP6097806.1 M13 family metallopeptidase [Gammaproteobacteria bacterium]MDP7455753.1 M13 family metallopeptidase [Gammaproteobacteria bacterium]